MKANSTEFTNFKRAMARMEYRLKVEEEEKKKKKEGKNP